MSRFILLLLLFVQLSDVRVSAAVPPSGVDIRKPLFLRKHDGHLYEEPKHSHEIIRTPSSLLATQLSLRGGGGRSLIELDYKRATNAMLIWYSLKGYFSCFAPELTCKAIGISDNSFNKGITVSKGVGYLAIATVAFLQHKDICNHYTALATALVIYLAYFGYLLLNEIPQKLGEKTLPIKLWMIPFIVAVQGAFWDEAPYTKVAMSCVSLPAILTCIGPRKIVRVQRP